MTDLWGRVAPDCPRNPPKTPPETVGTLVVCTGQIVLRRTPETARIRGRADVAQLVEHLHGKQEVSGSIPDVGLLSSLLPSPTGQGRAGTHAAGGVCFSGASRTPWRHPSPHRRGRHESPRSAPCLSDAGCCGTATPGPLQTAAPTSR